MSAHVQTGRTSRMVAAAIAAACAAPDEQMVALFTDDSMARHWKARCGITVPANLMFLGATRFTIGRINWAQQTVTIGPGHVRTFFDHDVVEAAHAAITQRLDDWTAKPGEYGYKEPA